MRFVNLSTLSSTDLRHGKSQTITSMLTAALARKKRVAVVCQKMVALEVIERNLNELGIRDGIAFITDPVKSRRPIVDAARARYDAKSILPSERTSISEKESKYSTLTETIVTQKRHLSEKLNANEMTFADCVGELAKIQRAVAPRNSRGFCKSILNLNKFMLGKPKVTPC